MDFIDVGDPRPRVPLLPFERFEFEFSSRYYLPISRETQLIDFFKVVMNRRSRRSFMPLDCKALGALLWHSNKTISQKELGNGHVWQHRPTPSAGGRHPIDLLIFSADGGAHVYDPIAHALDKLSTEMAESLSILKGKALEIVGVRDATVIYFIAHIAYLSGAYTEATSLIYRDAGALGATMALVSEALGLNFCILGNTGEPFVSRAFASIGKLHGVGACLVGFRGDDS